MKYTEEALNSEEYYELQEQESKIKSKKWMNVFLTVFSMLIIISLLVASSGSWTKFLIPNPPTTENKLSSTVHEEQVGVGSTVHEEQVGSVKRGDISDMYKCREYIKKDTKEYFRCCGTGPNESWCCSASDARAVSARMEYLWRRFGILGPEAAVGESAPVDIQGQEAAVGASAPVGIQGQEAAVGASAPVESNLESSVGFSNGYRLWKSMSDHNWELCREVRERVHRRDYRERLRACAGGTLSWSCEEKDLAYWKRMCGHGGAFGYSVGICGD